MAVEVPPSTAQPAPGAKIRILDTATQLFYLEGIHSIGVDRLISESSVTKATFYKHYGSKDALILAYIRARAAMEQERLERIVGEHDNPADSIRAVFADAARMILAPEFRGCAFINAAAEFPSETHPVRGLILDHRDWIADFLTGLLRELGHPLPGDGADDLQLVHDGAMTGGYAGDPIAATASLGRAVERLLAF
ncbi:TetR/AcrR family transcriptional regulator [Diaminobutyricimonas sp. TR449]|uniref:TetR/AcrR family transcriptional regulator n=1 Tax=Diaminobutyricimonas sp. TR449 TaxID=2708076 RepID=UPI001FBA762E|nr:TetR/AcrR family transcriptional regulator [Diaminobutyricimonas sp. TR449]